MVGRGRPKSTETKPVMVRMTEELIAKIDDARMAETDLPTRPEMIRRMLEDWKKAESAD